MLDQLLLTLIRSKNEAADDVLIEALRMGNPTEQLRVLEAMLQRKSQRGLIGVIELYDRLSEPLQRVILKQSRTLYFALREAGRSESSVVRVAAMKLIATGRIGRLAYVLSENLHDPNDTVSRSAADAMLGLARWAASETRSLQRGVVEDQANADPPAATQAQTYALMVEQRPEIEAAVARALDVHRGRHGQELLRAALLLCDSTASRTFAILATPKHGGQTPLSRRLQQTPTAEHVDAFLLGGSHGHLRSHFAAAFAHVIEAPALDALLRRTHWLKDHQLQLCLHQVGRGAWWSPTDLRRDIERRRPEEAAQIGEWIGLAVAQDSLQDERMDLLLAQAGDSVAARLRLLRVAVRQRHGGLNKLLKTLLNDPDERIARMAAREIVRRRPPDFENTLLQQLTTAPASVRRVIVRAVGQIGFDHFWRKFDRLPKETRAQAGRAMLKLLPDAVQRLGQRLSVGPIDQRLKALQIAHELGLHEPLKAALLRLCHDGDARLRSKAVMVVGSLPGGTPDVLIDRLINDTDARVRANTIEVLETQADARFIPILTERARTATNRERANAIKALCRMRVATVSSQLFNMLQDRRAEHRISAMWTLRQIGWWQLLNEVGRLAKADQDVRVRRYALGVLKNVAELAATAGNSAGLAQAG